MVIYNDSFMNNATNIVDLFIGVGNVSSNQYMIGYMILFSFFMIFLVLALKNNFVEVLIADSFITAIISIFLYGAGMLPVGIIAIPFIILIISSVFYWFFGG